MEQFKTLGIMKKYVLGIALLAGVLSFASCNNIDILSPPGPQGPEGKSAYELWLQALKDGTIEWSGETDIANYFKFLKGEPGESAYDVWVEYISDGTVPDPHNPGAMWESANNSVQYFYYFLTGAKGDDGLTPSINDQGYWVIGGTVTTVKAERDEVTIGANGNWFINGEDTTVPATGPQGDPGNTPEINDQGYWVVGGTVTTIKAERDEITIGANGNWFINGEDTSVPAGGPRGTDGMSAYQIWVDDVVNVHDVEYAPGLFWPDNKVAVSDFWNFVRGRYPDGSDPSAVVERTPLQFSQSERAGEYEEFTFATDPGATVTMNHEDETITGTADDNGTCVIKFPNSLTREFYAIVYAEIAGKLVSYPLSVRVPIRAPYYDLLVDFPNAEWYDSATGDPLDNTAEQYGYMSQITDTDGESIAFLNTYGRSVPQFVMIPFTSENIAKVTIEVTSGLGQFYVSVIPLAADNYSSGYLRIEPIDYGTVTGDTDIVITGITNQYIPVATIKFRATNTD